MYNDEDEDRVQSNSLWSRIYIDPVGIALAMLACSVLISVGPPILMDYFHSSSKGFFYNKDIYLVYATLIISGLSGLLNKCDATCIRTTIFASGSTLCVYSLLLYYVLYQPECVCTDNWLFKSLAVFLNIATFCYLVWLHIYLNMKDKYE